MSTILFSGGTVLTMDSDRPRAESVLVDGNRIIAVGDLPEVLRAAERTETGAERVDMRGGTLIPGFNDCHIHLHQLGSLKLFIDLKGLDKPQIIQRLEENRHRSIRIRSGEIMIGMGWDYTDCPDPHRRDLDAVFPATPVLLIQFSGHAAWLNSAALSLMGITPRKSKWKLGGAGLDADGKLTGIIREMADAPGIRKYWLEMMKDKETNETAIGVALARLAEGGITSCQDNTWFPWIVKHYARMHKSGRLTARISCWSMGSMPVLHAWFSLLRFNRDWYARGPRKNLIDGAFSTHTAWLSEPYEDKPETRGEGLTSDRIRKTFKDTRGQVAFHAIGDAAVSAYLDAVESVARKRDVERRRYRIEHGQLISDKDILRIRRLGMLVSAQPHAMANPAKDIRILGERRARNAYPFRSLLDAGVHLAFGSDFPGEETYNPLFGIHLAVNRDGNQAITPDEAIYAYTAGSAYAEFRENEKGKIAPGFLADLTLLSDDPTRVDRQFIKDVKVWETYVDGNRVFQRIPRHETR